MILYQNAVEEIQQEFPNFREPQIRQHLNKAYQEFCRKTGILRGKVKLSPDNVNWKVDGKVVSISLSLLSISAISKYEFRDISGNSIVPASMSTVDTGVSILTLTYDKEISSFVDDCGFIEMEVEAVLIPKIIFTQQSDSNTGVGTDPATLNPILYFRGGDPTTVDVGVITG